MVLQSMQAVSSMAAAEIYHEVNNHSCCRLLSSFHTTVGEITLIATPESEADPGQAPKTVQMRSFNDPSKGGAIRLTGCGPQPIHSAKALLGI